MRVHGEEPLCYLVASLLEEFCQDEQGGTPHCDPGWEEGASARPAWGRGVENLMANLFQEAGDHSWQDAGSSNDQPVPQMWRSLVSQLFQNGDGQGETGSTPKDPPGADMWRNLMSSFFQSSCSQSSQDAGDCRVPPFLQMFQNLCHPAEERPQPWEEVVDVSDLDPNTIELLAHNEEGKMVVRGYPLLSAEGETAAAAAAAAEEADSPVIREVQLPEGYVIPSVRYYLSAGKVRITGLRTKVAPRGTLKGEANAETTTGAAAAAERMASERTVISGEQSEQNEAAEELPPAADKETGQTLGEPCSSTI